MLMNSPNHTKRLSRGKRRLRRGATLVEFALVLPLFFLFLFAAFEFGWMNVLRHTADNAAYEAARHAMVPGATAAEATSKATALLKTIGARNAKVTVSPSTITSSTDKITVTIDVPMADNALVIPKFTGKKSIHATSTLRTERAQ
jgi:Flp pilus assembly protein TadG